MLIIATSLHLVRRDYPIFSVHLKNLFLGLLTLLLDFTTGPQHGPTPSRCPMGTYHNPGQVLSTVFQLLSTFVLLA